MIAARAITESTSMIARPVAAALQHYGACGRCLTTPYDSSDITPQRDRQKRKTNELVRLMCIIITTQIITRVPVCSISVPLWTPRVLLTPWTQFFLVVVILASAPLIRLQIVVSPGKNIEHLQNQITDSGCAGGGLGLAPAITASRVDVEKYSQRCGFMRRTSARSMGGPMM